MNGFSARRRQARRDRQRVENVSRAVLMHKARILAASQHASSASDSLTTVETEVEDKTLTQYFVGCSGWYYWHWRGSFYPADLPGSQWFPHYASHFETVELNAPFYSWPTLATVKTWVRQAGAHPFVYTIKVCELITHVKRFAGTKTLVRDFAYIAELLGKRMGCFLFQLPPSFHYTPARLKRILAQLDPTLKNVVEFRHRSWWNEKVFTAFRESGAIFCSCSGPKLPDELVKTADDVYIRFHGIKQWYRHDYSHEELAVWAGRIHACGAKRVWAYFNNDREAHAIQNARELLKQLKKVPAQSLEPGAIHQTPNPILHAKNDHPNGNRR